MYTSRYNWKRHETLNQFDGPKIQRYSCFFVETGVDGTTALQGGTLNFYGASAVKKKRVSAARGNLEKDSWDAQGGGRDKIG